MIKILEILQKKEFYMFIFTIILAFILYFLIKTVVNKIKVKSKRQNTIKHLLLQTVKVIIILVTLLICLSTLGINVASFIAGLGIASVIVGLALQDVMKDALAGIFIVLEDQYDVGDLVEISGFTGEVIKLGIKTTSLKNAEGKVKIISNRNISEVINYSKTNNFVILDIPISYEEDLKKVDKVLNKLAKEMDKKIKNIKGKTKILGINNFADSSLIYRITTEVKSGEQFTIQREIRRMIIDEFNKNNIVIPYNKIEVINGK